jgi:hypothetical protein
MRASLREFLLLAVSVFLGILLYDYAVSKLLRGAIEMDPDVFRYLFLTLSVTVLVLLLRKL